MIFGLDPGSHRTGWGIISDKHRKPKLVASGVIRPQQKNPLPRRLAEIHYSLVTLLIRYRPRLVVVEDQYTGNNPRTAMVIGQARGAATSAASVAGIKVVTYLPSSAKKTVAGHGGADKKTVNRAVREKLRIDTELQEDEADALALALCVWMGEHSAQ